MKTAIFTYSAMLLAIALVGYVASGATTALIPAFFALIFIALGTLALRERWRSKAMHTALVVAILAIFGTAGSLRGVVALLSGNEVARPLAVALQASTLLVSVLFIVAGVMSFINARKRREADS